MPATPQLFTPLHLPAGSPPDSVNRFAWSGLGSALAGLLDKFAPEGYEDDGGFHLQAVFEPRPCDPGAKPNCLGEHI